MTSHGAPLFEFRGSARFRLDGVLGTGGMGVVYRAWDEELRRVVALKTLPNVDPASLLRFKREFRALAEISHPNVVDLHELFCEDDHWFFTMELVMGRSFLEYVGVTPRPADAGERRLSPLAASIGDGVLVSTVDARTLDAVPDGRGEPTAGPRLTPPSARRVRPESARVAMPADEERLRRALVQLARGVEAIHAAGKLHRDVKPTNVLVTDDGRAVLLDFGVVGDLDPARGAFAEERIFGTPGYMAPEQAACQPTAPASDWYAVGAILYEALTGELPFVGRPLEVILDKQRHTPPPPSSLARGIPADLEDLAMALLRTDPATRPTGQDVLRVLLKASSSLLPAASGARDRVFFGRDAELAMLADARARARRGRKVLALVHGRSGAGKSVLIGRALEAARAEDAVVLAGRCYERESFPFKGIDGLVDELGRWLERRPEAELAEVAASDVTELARIFPVLRAVAPDAPPSPVPEPKEARRRAFAAFRSLVSRVAGRVPLVLYLDDLQWADADSVDLLEALLAPPASPPLLLVASYRDEMVGASAPLDRFLTLARRPSRAFDVADVPVAFFSDAQALELARSLVDAPAALGDDVLRTIARESGGSPFFVAQLVRWELERFARIEATGVPSSGRVVGIDSVIQARVARLPPDARRLLEYFAVARGPVEVTAALAAAGLEGSDRAALQQLRTARLIEVRGKGDEEVAETSHDRLRETVAAALAAEVRKSRHLRLAEILEGSGRRDPEVLLEHYLAADQTALARRWVLAAADAAKASLAFGRAARLYELGLELGADAPPWSLHRERAEALAASGRISEAAAAYLEAAGSAPADEGAALRRLAASHLLRTGRADRGLVLLREALSEVGLSYPESDVATLGALAYNRFRLRMRGLEFRPREPSREELERADVAYVAAMSLGIYDVLRSGVFGAKHLLLALDAGEPLRICRGLALEASNLAALGEPQRKRVEAIVAQVGELANRLSDPHAVALAKLCAGLASFFLGEWGGGRRTLDEALRVLRSRCRGVTFEIATADAVVLNALILSGEVHEALMRVGPVLREAEERGDASVLGQLVYPACIAALVSGDNAGAESVARHALPLESARHLTFSHWGSLTAMNTFLRFRHEHEKAIAHFDHGLSLFARSPLGRVELVRTALAFERGLCALSACDAGVDASAQLGVATAMAQKLAGEVAPYAPAMRQHLLAGIAAARGRPDKTREHLEGAVRGFDARGMRYLAACARYRLGRGLGGEEGEAAVRAADAYFAAEGIARDACIAVSAPGYGPTS